MIGWEDGTQATGFVTTLGITTTPTPPLFVVSVFVDVPVAVLLASEVTIVVGQALALFVGPISGELLLDNALSAELEARRRMDSSLDDFSSSFSRSSSLRIRRRLFKASSMVIFFSLVNSRLEDNSLDLEHYILVGNESVAAVERTSPPVVTDLHEKRQRVAFLEAQFTLGSGVKIELRRGFQIFGLCRKIVCQTGKLKNCSDFCYFDFLLPSSEG